MSDSDIRPRIGHGPLSQGHPRTIAMHLGTINVHVSRTCNSTSHCRVYM
ncbi:hypothetical protein [Massilia putida]|nr:hypothetical protein [Massilia putida]